MGTSVYVLGKDDKRSSSAFRKSGAPIVINIIKRFDEFRRFAGLYFFRLYCLQLGLGLGLDGDNGGGCQCGRDSESVIDTSILLPSVHHSWELFLRSSS
jgi:hypothetical protein